MSINVSNPCIGLDGLATNTPFSLLVTFCIKSSALNNCCAASAVLIANAPLGESHLEITEDSCSNWLSSFILPIHPKN